MRPQRLAVNVEMLKVDVSGERQAKEWAELPAPAAIRDYPGDCRRVCVRESARNVVVVVLRVIHGATHEKQSIQAKHFGLLSQM